MSTRAILLAALVAASSQILPAQKSTPDILPPARRQTTLQKAERLARPPAPPAVPEDLPHPFDPEGFDAPVAGTAAPVAGTAAPAEPAGPTTDREILEALAAQINPSGMIMLRNTPRLMIANKPFEIGTRFVVGYNGQDYELELTDIARTTFTLRFRNEEFTRPIRSTR